jgi:hypothetical protein
MRVGVLIRAEQGELERAHRLGFRSIEWVGFDTSPAREPAGHSFAEQFAAEARSMTSASPPSVLFTVIPWIQSRPSLPASPSKRAIEVAGVWA